MTSIRNTCVVLVVRANDCLEMPEKEETHSYFMGKTLLRLAIKLSSSFGPFSHKGT